MDNRVRKMIHYADWLSEAEQEIRQLNTGRQFFVIRFVSEIQVEATEQS